MASSDDRAPGAPPRPRKPSALADLRDRLAGWLDDLRDDLVGATPAPVPVPVTVGGRQRRR